MLRRSIGSLVLATVAALVAAGCASEASEEAAGQGADALSAKSDAEWFYTGRLPQLKNASVVVSLMANTMRVRGDLPDGFTGDVSGLPHVRQVGRHVDVVYPIASAAIYSANSRQRDENAYSFHSATPYKPDANATTRSNPTPHWVTWGGFPFLAYNGGIAFHGPITCDTASGGCGSQELEWYLRRGRVSSACNRMNGEHVVEVAHILGLSMRKLYRRSASYDAPALQEMGSTLAEVGVTVTDDFDKLDDGKWVDVDYPTWDPAPVTRAGSVHGAGNVAMFGSWVATEVSAGGDGNYSDLPSSHAGLGGVPYVFRDHVLPETVCSYPPDTLRALAKLADAQPGKELPMSICGLAPKRCAIDAIHSNADSRAGAIEAAGCFGVSPGSL